MGARETSEGRAGRGGGGLATAAIVCGVFGAVSWAFYFSLFRRSPVQDWMVFYSVARAYFDANLPLVFDGEALTAAINQRFAAWLTLPLPPHPWVYPPSFLMLFLPFGALPPLWSVASFVLTGYLAAIAAVVRFADSGIRRWTLIGTLVLCPAVPFDVLTGQNAFYTAALLVGGFWCVRRYPFTGGLLLGLLSVKPQFGLLAWVALLALREWRALCGVAASACGMALASLAIVGVEAWRAWLDLMTGGNAFYQSWIAVGRLNGISVYACVRWLGVPAGLADLGQAAAAVLAAGMVYRVYRRPAPDSMRLATVLAATVLAAPHVSNSDAVLLGLAAALVATNLPPSPLRPLQLTVAAAVWICPLLNPPALSRAGCATPVLLLLLLAMIAAVIRRRDAFYPAPEPASA